MKKSIVVILVLATVGAVVFLTSCGGKLKQLANINFDIPYNQQITVPGTGYAYGTPLPGGGITLPFPAVPVATNSQQYITQYHTSADKILMVNLKSMNLQIASPSGQNFDFLDNISIYISAKNQPEMLIASQNSVPKGQTTLNFTVPDSTVNLKSYFLADTMYFRLSAHINAVPPTGEQLQLSSVFHVLANPLY